MEIFSSVNKILDGIISSDFVRNIQFNAKETEKTLARNVSKNHYFHLPGFEKYNQDLRKVGYTEKGAQQYVKDSVHDLIGDTTDVSSKIYDILKDITTSNADEKIEQIKPLVSSLSTQQSGPLTDNQVDALNKGIERRIREGLRYQEAASKGDFNTYLEKSMGKIDYYINKPLAYFSPEDKQVRNDRIIAAAGIYTGIAATGRFLKGGTLTRNEYGESDIAGIPFI